MCSLPVSGSSESGDSSEEHVTIVEEIDIVLGNVTLENWRPIEKIIAELENVSKLQKIRIAELS